MEPNDYCLCTHLFARLTLWVSISTMITWIVSLYMCAYTLLFVWMVTTKPPRAHTRTWAVCGLIMCWCSLHALIRGFCVCLWGGKWGILWGFLDKVFYNIFGNHLDCFANVQVCFLWPNKRCNVSLRTFTHFWYLKVAYIKHFSDLAAMVPQSPTKKIMKASTFNLKPKILYI